MNGTESFEKELEKRNFISEKIKGTRINFRTKNETMGKSKTFRVKTSRYYRRHTWYSEGADAFASKGKVDFYVFSFFKKDESGKTYYIVVPRKELTAKIRRKGRDVNDRYHFYFQLRKDNEVVEIRDGKEEDYSKYLDKKGWRLIEKALN